MRRRRRRRPAPAPLAAERQPPLQDLQAVAVASLLLVEPRQGLQRLIVLGALVEDADTGRDGLVDVAHVALEQARHPPPQLLAGAGIVGQIDPLAQDLHPLAMLRSRLEDPIQRVDRLPLLRIALQDRAQRGDRRLRVAERFLLEAGDPVEDLLPLRRPGRPARLEGQDLDQARHVARLGVERLERRRRRSSRLEVVRVDVEDQLPDVDGRPTVAELLRIEPRRARQQVGAAAHVRHLQLESELLVDVDQLGEPLEGDRQPFDLRERLGVAGIGRQHLPPGCERDGAGLQARLLQLGDAGEQRPRRRSLERLPLHLQDRDQAGPGSAPLVDRRRGSAPPAAGARPDSRAARAGGARPRGTVPPARFPRAARALPPRRRGGKRAARRGETPAPAPPSPTPAPPACRAASRGRASARAVAYCRSSARCARRSAGSSSSIFS